MAATLELAFTADLHWGHHARGMEANHALVRFLCAHPPDVLVLAGDIGTGAYFAECLAAFAAIPCRKALVPGNHDVWVPSEAPHDSFQLYREQLPGVAQAHGFHYLDEGPFLLPEADLALVGSINWYDYSWSLAALRERFPEELHRLESKRFTRGRHNDANYVRWPHTDGTFTAEVVARFRDHLTQACNAVDRAIVVTHHPPFYGLGFPRPCPPTSLDSLLWDALCGNQAMERELEKAETRIPFAFCGHTHRARTNRLGAIAGHNIGGDYHFKRLLWLSWPTGTIVSHQFGEENR